MRVEIDGLTESELIDLNHRIVARLRFLSEMRAHANMLEFRVGDRVTFQPDGGPPLYGTLTRYNKKTVTVITEDGALECITRATAQSSKCRLRPQRWCNTIQLYRK